MTLLRRMSLRFYLRHPWQLALALAGISLGVAVYVGVRLANDSAGRAFDVAAERLRGSVTHRLLPIDGPLDESIYRDLVLGRGIAHAAPVVEGEARIASDLALRVPLLGIEPLAQLGSSAVQGTATGEGTFARLIAEPGAALLPAALGEELEIDAGESLALRFGERTAQVRVIGLYPGAGAAEEPPILTDISTAQELLDMNGRISRVDLELTDSQARALDATPVAGTLLIPTSVERSSLREITTAFRTNLTALGLLALVVGMFLIYGTMAFAILQRTQTLGVLRALGVSRGEIMTAVVAEAATIAAMATVLGLLLGHVLATSLVDLVLRTIGDLSFGRTVGRVDPSPWIYAQGAALGIAATLVAAAKPALDAARTAPAATLRRAALERQARRAARRAAWVALPVLAASAAVLAYGSSALPLAFAGLFGMLAAGALLTPLWVARFTSALDRLLGQRLGIAVTLAVRGVGASLSRTGVAVAALAVAVATVNGVGLMIESFRSSLDTWLDTTLTADIYVTTADGADLDALSQSGALMAIDGVVGFSLTRARVVPTPSGEIAIRAVQPGVRGFGLDIVRGDAAEALGELGAGRGVVASERLLFARGLDVGDVLELPAPGGPERAPIVGAFRDFNTGVPAIVMTLDRYREVWRDSALDGIGLDVRDDTDLASVEAAARALASPYSASRVRSSARIAELSLAVFDRTFQVTEVLRLLAGIVAFLGILSALLAIELERARELSVLRTLGFTPRGLSAMLLTQTGLLGLAAGLAAVPIGSALAALLVHVINRRSFGWSMEFVMTGEAVISGLVLALAAALLAGLYPAWRASHVELAEGLRED